MKYLRLGNFVLAFCFCSLFSQSNLAQNNERVTIGIGGITSSIPQADPYSFQTMLETQLIKTNKFNVIERSRLEEILREKGLSAAGITNGGSGEISGIKGVNYLFYGSITKLGATSKSFNTGGASAIGGGVLSAFHVPFGGLAGAAGNVGVASSKVQMAVDLRIVNAQDGSIKVADTVEEQVDGSSASSVAGIRTENTQGDPRGDVERLTAKSIAALIVTTIYPIKIIAAQTDGTFVVNYGDSVLTVGDQLGVYQVGQAFKDPDTGEVLGADEKQVGVLSVVEVNPKFSKVTLVSGNVTIGNTARRLSSTVQRSQPVAYKHLPGDE